MRFIGKFCVFSKIIMSEDFERDFKYYEVSTPRLIFTSAVKGAGVSSIIIGLLAHMSQEKTSVAVGHIGPSLVKSTHHRRLTGRLSHTLDLRCLSKQQIIDSFARLSSGTELVFIEDQKGVMEESEENLSLGNISELSLRLGAPVVLVVDASEEKMSLKEQIDSFIEVNPEVEIAAIIASKAQDKEQSSFIEEAVDGMGGPVFLGATLVDEKLRRPDGLGDSVNPSLLPRSAVVGFAKMIREGLRLENMKDVAQGRQKVKVRKSLLSAASRQKKIAVADDVAFHLTVQDNLDLIRREGGTLSAFSPITDLKLPSNCKAIYFPSGYVHLYAADLERNKTLRTEIAKFIADGGVVYAEGSAASYLCEHVILSDGTEYEMLGAIPARASATIAEDEWVEPEFCSVVTFEDSVLSEKDVLLRGYRERRWRIEILSKVELAFEYVKKVVGENDTNPSYSGMMPTQNVIASNMQFHWAIRPQIARRFVQFSSRSRED